MKLNSNWTGTSTFAAFFVTVNVTGLIVEFLRRGDTPIHFYYETISFKLLLLLNLPAIAIVESLFVTLNSLIKSHFAPRLALPFIISISLQWILLSAIIARICKRK